MLTMPRCCRPRRALSNLIALVVLLQLVLVVASCQIPDQGRFGQLRKGMQDWEVLTLLGNPSSKTPAVTGKDGKVVSPASWNYGDNLSTLASGTMFKDQPPPENVWSVFFGTDGRVSGWRTPNWEE
jgi:hypothetical protein